MRQERNRGVRARIFNIRCYPCVVSIGGTLRMESLNIPPLFLSFSHLNHETQICSDSFIYFLEQTKKRFFTKAIIHPVNRQLFLLFGNLGLWVSRGVDLPAIVEDISLGAFGFLVVVYLLFLVIIMTVGLV